jgi:hypothetical protein
MKREQLAYLLALSSLLGEKADILVVGSQAILGVIPEGKLPPEAVLSVEADITFLDADEEKADRVDVMLGEDSKFHHDFGFYAQGVGVTTASLPKGWRERLVRFPADLPGGAAAYCPDLYDLLAAKLAALREKDIVYATALVNAGLINLDLLEERVGMLPSNVHQDVIARIRDLIDGWRTGLSLLCPKARPALDTRSVTIGKRCKWGRSSENWPFGDAT